MMMENIQGELLEQISYKTKIKKSFKIDRKSINILLKSNLSQGQYDD